MLKTLAFLLLLLPASLLAQNTITGKVISATKPVPDASVFLSNASVGSKTLDDGSFTLNNVKNGQYDMVISCIGYETYHQTVMMNGVPINLSDISLVPKITELKEVKVRFDNNRDRYVKMFIDEFIGRSENARECKLLNPELLDIDFDQFSGKLTASTSDFLIIENKALGYRVKYLLKSFLKNPRSGYVSYVGSSVFEPLTGKSSEEKRWVKKRMQVYRGSDMHFLRSCIAQQVPEEGFTVRRLIRAKNPNRPSDSVIRAKLQFFRGSAGYTEGFNDSLNYWAAKSRLPAYTQTLIQTPIAAFDYIKLTEEKGIYAFGYTDCLHITYKTDRTSIVTFQKPFSFFDSNGIIVNPESNTVEGYWGSLRIAELLPVDYELPGTF